MLVPQRHSSSADYRYGFQGQEKDDEIKGEGNSLNYTFRMHDPRVGRFFAVDPLEKKFPFYSPYQFSSNSPIMSIELEGLESSSTGTNIIENDNSTPDYNADIHVIVNKEIVIVAERNVNKINSETGKNQDNQVWTPELTNQFYPAMTKDNYIDKYGAEKYYQYNSKDAKDFHDWTLDKIKESNDAELLFKLSFFKEAFTTISDFIIPFQGFNVVRSLGSGTNIGKFNYKPRYKNANPYSSHGFREISNIDELKGAKGLYMFPDATENSLLYVGKSNKDVFSRISAHTKAGKFTSGSKVYFKPLIGSPTQFEVQETIMINNLGGLEATANKLLPVSVKRNKQLQLGITNYSKYGN